MSTLWSKGTQAADIVEDFTVGNDRILDMRLAEFDVIGSKAHIKMLESIGLLGKDELETLTEALDAILEEIRSGQFILEDDVEDIHSRHTTFFRICALSATFLMKLKARLNLPSPTSLW